MLIHKVDNRPKQEQRARVRGLEESLVVILRGVLVVHTDSRHQNSVSHRKLF